MQPLVKGLQKVANDKGHTNVGLYLKGSLKWVWYPTPLSQVERGHALGIRIGLQRIKDNLKLDLK